MKMIMVQLITKSFRQQISETEYSLLNILRSMLCQTGIFEYELNKIEQQYGGEGSNVTTG